jgi:NADPH:quinone reductase-like Zn-dependent oxidoreductase
VLVNGAGGGVGVIAVQLAKAYGATVTAVDSTGKLAMLRSIGADRVIDYTREDFTEGDERYDFIFDIPGNHSFAACRRVLTPEGTYVLIAHDQYGAAGRAALGSLPRFLGLVAMAKFVPQLPDPGVARPTKQDAMAELRELLETGQLTPVVDRTFPLSQVREALRYLEQGGVQGKVVITV